MKKIFTMLALLAFAAGVSAQEVPNHRYINLFYANQKLDFGAYGSVEPQTLKSDYSMGIEFGNTYFFNGKRPTLGMLRFGLDFSYADLQYASYKIKGVDEFDIPIELDGHFVNFGMQVGPSVTVTPLDWLNARVYVHYAPVFRRLISMRSREVMQAM